MLVEASLVREGEGWLCGGCESRFDGQWSGGGM